MNRARRDKLSELMLKIESLSFELEALKDEEDEYRENMPENLQYGEKYEASETASDNMGSAIDSLNEAMDYINEATN